MSHPSEEMYCPGCESTFYGVEYCPNDGAKLVRLVAQPDQLIGRTFDGRYTIVEKLGEGGMGSVYRSRQHSFGREVAIKVVNPALVTDPMIIRRFLREAKLSSRLSHPNAVAVLDFGQTDDGIFYLVMELVNGRTLHDAMAETPQFSPERVVRIGAQICDALECAHDLGIVHRDLKPSNVMLLTSGRDLVKVLDFGLAKSLAADDRGTTMTGTRGGLMGTPAFVAPELALGKSCDHRADLYSLGCILYLIGSGWPPFSAANGAELISKHAYEQPAPMPNAPAGLVSVVMRLLEKNPQDRFSSATETRQALEDSLGLPHVASMVSLPAASSGAWSSERLLDGPSDEAPMLLTDDVTAVSVRTVRAESPTRIVHQRRPMRLAPVAATFLVLALLGGGGYYWFSFRAQPSAAPAEPAAAAPLPPAIAPAPAPQPPAPEVEPAPLVVPDAAVEEAPELGSDAEPAEVVAPTPTPTTIDEPPARGSKPSRRSRRRAAAAAQPTEIDAGTEPSEVPEAPEAPEADEGAAPDDGPPDPNLPDLEAGVPPAAPAPVAPVTGPVTPVPLADKPAQPAAPEASAPSAPPSSVTSPLIDRP
ncbi:MAG: serine/threonine-protein kinase [Kofleriaceae bacterium]